MTEVLETAELAGRTDAGALRLRTIALKDRPGTDFPYKTDDGYEEGVLLDWTIGPCCRAEF